jgi:hypothetical protein
MTVATTKKMLQGAAMILVLDQGVKRGRKQNQKLAGWYVWNSGIRRKKITGSLD